jgi:succinate dehydrogenase / fumarate reductase, cytochrome b subunit
MQAKFSAPFDVPILFLQQLFQHLWLHMKWSEFFTSSVGKKLVMAITGLSLILFLIVHVTVNSLMWSEIFVVEEQPGEIFNKAAAFLGETLVPRVLEIGLFLFIILHIVQGYVLVVKNRSKRSTGYEVKMGTKGSTWYSKSMGLLGTLIFLFLIVHIADFWVPSRFHQLEPVFYGNEPEAYANLYGKMVEVFQNPWIVVLYVVGCISLAYHLIHGFQSSFRTLGLSNNRYISLLQVTGVAFSIIVCLAFAMMPVSIYAGWVK